MPVLLSDAEILNDINSQLPPGIDWQAGAVKYLQSVQAAGVAPDARQKPFWRLNPNSPPAAYAEVADLLGTFVDVFKLLQLKAGSRILDVACGTGWLAALWTKLGYQAYGFDICSDFIELARHRMIQEGASPAEAAASFQVHDIETGPLRVAAPIDAALFESCFHHFYNPVAALRNIAAMLSGDGVAVLIEGGNHITPEFREVMLRYGTIERPYSRRQIKNILRAAGMPYFAFFAPLNYWVAEGYSSDANLRSNLESAFLSQNRCVCATTETAIRRILPDWRQETPVEMGAGVYAGSEPDKWWCGPHAQIRILEDCSLTVQLGPTTVNQIVSAFSSRRGKLASLELPEPRSVTFSGLEEGDRLHLCSTHAFSPAWSGNADPRILSFWLEAKPDTG